MNILGPLIPAWMHLTNPLSISERSSPLNTNIDSSTLLGDGKVLSHQRPIPSRARQRSVEAQLSFILRLGRHRAVLQHSPGEIFPTASLSEGRSTKLVSAAVGGLKIRASDVDVLAPGQQKAGYPVNPNHHDSVLEVRANPKTTGTRPPDAGKSSRALIIDESRDLVPPCAPVHGRVDLLSTHNRFARPADRPGRLWNPTNFTPKLPPAVYTQPIHARRRRRPSTPPPPAISVAHPTIDVTAVPDDQSAIGAGDYPLLTLPEQRQSRHPTPTRSSFQVDGRVSGNNRISVPDSVRLSYDLKATFGAQLEADSAPVMSRPNNAEPGAGFSNDLERGPDRPSHQYNRSNISLPGGIGSAISSSDSSIVGDPDQPGLGDEWGPQHPCFPHLNPYVPINSVEYQTTRIIRVQRDWLVVGDLAPTFSNLYPEILDAAGISEQEFRRVVEKLNDSLIPIFNPYNWRNILDGVLGVLSGWVWEDLGLTNVKTKLNGVEAWIEKWNAEMEKTLGSEEGVSPPKIISLRRTGYMTLDFQIPDPELFRSHSEPGSRSGPAMAEATTEPVASSAL
ncbi:Golgin subfamily A member 7/ERF4 family-domain-containing protein [Poronia punctata]|nr:Golgin subfamily A member 7/ERF4 family-domain-containing protein [Poronia punctata]